MTDMMELVEPKLLSLVREQALICAYQRIYPGLVWDERSEIGEQEAKDGMMPRDVFEAVRVVCCGR